MVTHGGLGRLAAVVLLALLLGACEGGERSADGAAAPPPVAFDTGAVVIESAGDTLRLPVELALTEEQRAWGLMERPSLPDGWGMLFVYEEARDSTAGFWMYRTWIPLDIAFLDAGGRILDIRSMEPCESPNPRVCRHYGPGEPFVAALEVNRGFFEARGIERGDRIRRVE